MQKRSTGLLPGQKHSTSSQTFPKQNKKRKKQTKRTNLTTLSTLPSPLTPHQPHIPAHTHNNNKLLQLKQ